MMQATRTIANRTTAATPADTATVSKGNSVVVGPIVGVVTGGAAAGRVSHMTVI